MLKVCLVNLFESALFGLLTIILLISIINHLNLATKKKVVRDFKPTIFGPTFSCMLDNLVTNIV